MQRELRIMAAMAGALVLAGCAAEEPASDGRARWNPEPGLSTAPQLRREPGGRGVELIIQCSRVATSAGTKEINGGPNHALRRVVPAVHAGFHP